MPGTRSIHRLPALAAASFLAALLVGLGAARSLEAGPGDTKSASKPGSAYRNERLGLTADVPEGWRMVVDKGGAPSSWKRLVTFNDRATDAQAVLSVRPRSAANLDQLMATTQKAWDKSRGVLRVDSMRKIEPSALQQVGRILVDASFTREAPAKPAKDGVAPPPVPPVTYRVQATYLLGPENEYLLYATGQKTHWSRLRTPLKRLAASIRFTAEEKPGVKGEGSYRSDAHGFSCMFPKDYTVVQPQRSNHVALFEGKTKEEPLLSVYAIPWEETALKDAERLVTHYEEDKGGTASFKTHEVGGQEGVLVTARAVLSGEERTIQLVIVKRGKTCFRLRASMPQRSEAKGMPLFDAFVSSFRLHAAPK